MKKLIAAALAVLMLFSLALAESSGDGDLVIEEVILDEENPEGKLPEATEAPAAAEKTVFTPSYGSPYSSDLGSSYWTLPMDITDEEAVWKMLMEPMTVVRIGSGNQEKKQTYLYKEPDENSKKVGVVTRDSQGVRVIEKLDSGWSLVECYSSSFHDTKVKAWNMLVQGYIKTEYLTQVQPNPNLGIVVDKLTQRLYIFQDGKLLTTLLCSTGLVR